MRLLLSVFSPFGPLMRIVTGFNPLSVTTLEEHGEGGKSQDENLHSFIKHSP